MSLLQTTDERGIVISAGGKYYLPQAIILLRILRYNLKSTLPVEIFWLNESEMDDLTFKVRWGQGEVTFLVRHTVGRIQHT